MKTVIMTMMFFTMYLASIKGQTELPLKTTWMKSDSYGRMYDTKVPKERYRTNSNGEIEGLYILYYEDGKTIQNKITYKNGKKNGLADLGYASGNYKNDLAEGEWIYQYFSEIEIVNYIQGVIVGKSITYSDKSRTKIVAFTEYKNGVPDGKHTSYFEDGKIKEEGNYLNGKKTGYWIEYGPELTTSEYICSEGNYVNGNRDGVWTNYGKCYSYLDGYGGGKKYSYTPKKTENSYIEFTGGSDVAYGPKFGYSAEYMNGTYLKDYPGSASNQTNNNFAPQESLEEKEKRLEEKEKRLDAWLDKENLTDELKARVKADMMKQYKIELKLYDPAAEQDSIRMAKEKVENDYIEMINGIKEKPLTKTELDFVGNWEFKSEKMYTPDKILIYEESFTVNRDRTYTYKSFKRIWLDKQVYQEYNEKGIWEIKDKTFYAYINEEDGKPSKRIDPMKFETLSEKKATRIYKVFNDYPEVKLVGKKVSKASSFDSNSVV